MKLGVGVGIGIGIEAASVGFGQRRDDEYRAVIENDGRGTVALDRIVPMLTMPERPGYKVHEEVAG
jgi:hypothetical protein